MLLGTKGTRTTYQIKLISFALDLATTLLTVALYYHRIDICSSDQTTTISYLYYLSTMQIIVKYEGSNDAITLTVEPSHTIKNVKDQIKNENAFPMPVPVSEARLVCRKDPNVRDFFLKDDNTLLSYGIQDGCEIGLSYSIVTGDRKLDEDMIVEFVTILLVSHLYNSFQIHLTLMD